MTIIRWAAVAVTALMALMNIGVVVGTGDQKAAAFLILTGLVLGIAGLVAVVGFLRGSAWGRPALLGVAGLNLVGGVIAAVADMDGAVIGIVLSALGLVLGYLAASPGATTLRAPSSSLH
jgi:hypothetical protein